MGDLFDLLANNFIIVIIIIGGIIRLLSGSTKNEEEQNKRPTNRPRPYNVPGPAPRPTPTPSGGPARSRSTVTRQTNPNPIETISIEEQQQKQLEKLAGRMNAGVSQSMENLAEQDLSKLDLSHHSFIDDEAIKRQTKLVNHHKKKFKKQIERKLTQKGLVDSIIMAEVLGPPRARKPYRSVISERRG